MNKRTCTSCLKPEGEVEFISSSGNYCELCMSEVRAREYRRRQAAKERWQWLTYTDEKPEKKEKAE